jgi:hypothetical protein
LKAYWRQQEGYGKAEALLERKWPDKYNTAGHVAWAGRVYSKGVTQALAGRGRIYSGVWGTALFQSLYEPAPGTIRSLTLMPEWYLVIALLAAISVIGLSWRPLLLAAPLLLLAVCAPVVQAWISSGRTDFTTPALSRFDRVQLRLLTASLHLLQPLARLWGRLRNGLNPWRLRVPRYLALPVPRMLSIWTEEWTAPDSWLTNVVRGLQERHAVLRHGGDFDAWDLQIRGGCIGSARVLMAIEEHGAGQQLARFHIWPRTSRLVLTILVVFAALGLAAAFRGAWIAFGVLGGIALALSLRILYDCGLAVATSVYGIKESAG